MVINYLVFCRFISDFSRVIVYFDINRIYDLKGKRDEIARVILEDVAMWFIKEGLSEYYRENDLSPIERFIRDHGAYLVAEISIDRYGYLAKLDIGSLWVRSTVICYSRVQNDVVYEYWVVDRFGGTRSDVRNEIYFLIAKFEGLNKKREIIHRTEKFFSQYITPEGTVIQFPMDNKSVYRLRPWIYPDAFKGTELEGIKVVIN